MAWCEDNSIDYLFGLSGTTFSSVASMKPPSPSAGIGKSHLAIAFARSLIRNGARGLFFNVVDLVNGLETEARSGRQGRIADHLTRLDFVVLANSEAIRPLIPK